MSKKKKGSFKVEMPKKEDNVVFRQSSIEATLAKKPYIIPGFRTGKYMTEKDRPRKNKWSIDE